jgi:putative transcriptional regulator
MKKIILFLTFLIAFIPLNAQTEAQQKLADAVNVSRQTINAIENGDYNPTINLCIAICRVLGKTLDELFWE